MKFILENIILFALLIVSGGALLLPGLLRRGSKVSVLQATQTINQGKALILDVREPDEFAAGHLRDAKNISRKTLASKLDEMDLMWLPIMHDWRLNERHYGALQGLNKAETAAQYGDAQVMTWRRSYDIPPPPLTPQDPRTSYDDPRYASLEREQIPLTECLKDNVARVLPAWNESIAPAIRAGKRIIISAHGNSLRALIKMLDGISDADIVGLNIPNGQPLVYELDADLKPIKSYYLGDQAAIAAAAQAVANQGKAK